MSARLNALAAAAFACLSFAAPAVAQERAPVTARVMVSDLNLSSPAGMATLRSRVRRAASAACGVGGGGLAEIADAARCRREMQQDGTTQIAALVHSDIQVATAR